MLYLRNNGIGLDATARLCRVPGVAGGKWAPLRLAAAIRRADRDIVWVRGLAESWAPPLRAVGARGFTPGLINVWPAHSLAIHAVLGAGDYPRANELIVVMNAFEELRAEEQNGTNVTVVKPALPLIGHDCGPRRPPSAWPLTDRQLSEHAMGVSGGILIGSDPVRSRERSLSPLNRATNEPLALPFAATTADVGRVGALAGAAFEAHHERSLESRPRFLESIATNVSERGNALIEHRMTQTGLRRGRLEGERARTVEQLRRLANVVRAGEWLDLRVDRPLADRKLVVRCPDVETLVAASEL
jgi:hypothetical protein